MSQMKNEISQTFSGLECHNFVRLAEKVMNISGPANEVIILGREPITTIEIFLKGKVVAKSWDKYDRGIVIQTSEGKKYKVGGTNTTSSIASQAVIFPNVPIKILPPPISKSELYNWINNLNNNRAYEKTRFLSSIITTLRSTKVIKDIKEKLQNQSFFWYEQINTFTCDPFDDPAQEPPEHNDWISLIECLANSISIFSDNEKIHICNIASLIGTQRSVKILSEILYCRNPLLSREAALNFRQLEGIIQKLLIKQPHETNDLLVKLSEYISGDNDQETQVYLTEALGYYSNNASILGLANTLKNNTEDHVRWAAGVALARQGDINKTVPVLIKSLLNDDFVNVKRSILLGIGRILAKLKYEPWESKHFSNQYEQLLTFLRKAVKDFSIPAITTYAIYAYGELHEFTHLNYEPLIDALNINIDFPIRSNAILALAKMTSEVYPEENQILRIEQHLEENLKIEAPTEYPASAYYSWFFEQAGEVLVRFQKRELAGRYYKKAAEVFESISWRSNYYKGIADCEFAEYWFSKGDLVAAISYLKNAISYFQQIITENESEVKYSEKVQGSIAFRENMAEARICVIQAVSKWNSPAMTIEDSSYNLELFNEAAKKYLNVLRLEDGGNKTNSAVDDIKKLTGREKNLLRALLLLVGVGRQIEELSLSYELNEEIKIINHKIGKLSAEIRKFVAISANTKLSTFQKLAAELKIISEKTIKESSGDQQRFIATLGGLIWDMKEVFKQPVPTPAIECQIIGPGKASLDIILEGAISGDGQVDTPYLFASDKRLIIRAVVEVMQRAQNEVLVFRTDNSRNNHVVHIHEGTMPIPIDYGILSPAKSANCFNFFLDFKNSGCIDTVAHEAIWVKIIDSKQLSIENNDLIRKRIKLLKNKISATRREIAGLEKVQEKKYHPDVANKIASLNNQLDEYIRQHDDLN